MVDEKKLGWTFSVDSIEGTPFFQCPYCSRKVSGKTIKFRPYSLNTCPSCGKSLHFDNIKEEDLEYIDSYYRKE